MAGKKGLGTGLNALFGEAERDESQEIQMLPISRVEPREAQPRTNLTRRACRSWRNPYASTA